MQLANYLFFTTACEPALAFYSECGLGRVTLLVRHGERGLPVAQRSHARQGHARQIRGTGRRVLCLRQ